MKGIVDLRLSAALLKLHESYDHSMEWTVGINKFLKSFKEFVDFEQAYLIKESNLNLSCFFDFKQGIKYASPGNEIGNVPSESWISEDVNFLKQNDEVVRLLISKGLDINGPSTILRLNENFNLLITEIKESDKSAMKHASHALNRFGFYLSSVKELEDCVGGPDIELEEALNEVFINQSNRNIICLDKNKCIIRFNKTAEKDVLAVYQKQIELHKSIFDYIGEEEVETNKYLNHAFEGKRGSYSITKKLNDNTERHFIIDARPVFDHNKEVIAIIMVTKDKTERIKKDFLLEEKQEDLNLKQLVLDTLLEKTEIGFKAYDRDFNLLFINGVAKKVNEDKFGIDLELGDNLSNVEPQKYKSSFFEGLKKESNQNIHQLKVNDQLKYFESDTYPIIDDQGVVKGGLEIVKDITNKELERKAVENQKATLDAVLNSTKNGIYAVDRDLNVIVINEQAVDDFKENGYDVKLGSNLNDVIETKALNQWKDSYFDRVFSGVNHTYVGESKGKYVENLYSPVTNNKGEIIACLELSRDITKLRRQQKSLQESEKQLRTLVEHVPTSLVKVSLSGKIRFVNARVSDMFGYPDEEMLDNIVFKYIDQSYHGILTNRIGQLISGKKEVFDQFKAIRKDGSKFYIEGLASLIRDEKGKPFEFLLAFYDITERVEAKKTLESTRANYDLLFKNMNDAIVYYDIDNQLILDHNQSALDLFKLSTEKLKTKNIDDLIKANSNLYPKENFIQNNRQKLVKVSEGITTRSNYVFKDSEDNEILAEVTITPSYDEKNRAYYVIKDITKSYLNQIDAQEKATVYGTMIDNSSEGIDIIKYDVENKELVNGTLMVRNDNMVKFLGDREKLYDNLDDVSGLDITEYMGQNKTQVLNQIKDELSANAHSQLGFRINFGEIHFDIQAIHTLSKLEGKIYLVRNFVDVTEQRKSENIIRQQINDLNKKNEELQKYIDSNLQLENFAYIASHDLKAPIRSVISFMQLLRKNLLSTIDEKNLRFIDIILEASTNMQVLIDDLLSYSRINTQALEFEEVDVNILIERLLIDLNAVVTEKEAEIVVAKMPSNIYADESRLRQVFQNLITNGIKFIDKDNKPKLNIEYKDLGDYHQFSVRDNGIGIEKTYLDKIFLMFKKLHSENKYQGTGIGLSICKKVIDQHLGEIWVDSELGKGSTFHFTVNKNIKL